ncbi:hypothetical protein E4U37_005233 [Claviceps purpurea]|nr:hypothetical protein E4U37_005233 [Claviceps purpurea]
MHVKQNFVMLYTRIQSVIRNRSRRQRRQPDVEISAPFGLKREAVNLPGVSQEELSILREKAAASQIGILELRPESPMEYDLYKRARPSPRLRSAVASYASDETRSRVFQDRPLWY